MLKRKLAVRSTCRWGASHKRPPMSPYKHPVSRQVLEKLVAGIADLRDRAIILFLMDTGARVSELVLQNRDMIKVRTGVLSGEFKFAATATLPATKSNGQRQLYVSARALEALNLYLESRKDANPALFATRSGERLRSEQVRRLLHAWCARLGIERFPAHDFRRSLAESLVVTGSPYVMGACWDIRCRSAPLGRCSRFAHDMRKTMNNAVKQVHLKPTHSKRAVCPVREIPLARRTRQIG
jgi:integrase